jgi:UDPglucose 6-dehydrogenase
MIKYASNGFLAVKISYINEMANLCDAVGTDVKMVSKAMRLDKRICPYFLNPGPGFGGSCFPKDSQALLYTAEKNHTPLEVVKASLIANAEQKKVPFKKLCTLMKSEDLAGKTVAVLGLAFKGNTDDIRYSPSITVIKELFAHGARVQTYDPQAMANMKMAFSPDKYAITYCDTAYEACASTDAVMIMTEWDKFKTLDLQKIASCVKNKMLVDVRNIIDIEQLKKLDFVFDSIGRTCMRSLR